MMIISPRPLKRVIQVDRETFVRYKTPVLLGVMALNFLLTGFDVLVAHSQNVFFRWELIPLMYAPAAVLAVSARIVFKSSDIVGRLFRAVMWLGVVVGVTGSLFHLAGNATSGPVSLRRLLVSGSPVAAPIAFAGIAAFALVSDHYRGADRRSKLLALVGLGFLGAVLAAFFDHARVSFASSYTLIPLVTGALATVACFYMARPERTSNAETYVFLAVITLSVVVGVLGFGLHLAADLAGTQSIVWARLLYRAPLLGPLLFANLALLAGLSMLPEPEVANDERLYPDVVETHSMSK